jgi:mRNA interferase MazF
MVTPPAAPPSPPTPPAAATTPLTPRRGEIYQVNWNPARGSEQAALVIQNDIGNTAAPTTIVVAVTSKKPSKPYPFIVELADASLPKASFANCAQIYTIDKTRLGQKMGVAPAAVMQRVDEALRVSLQLPAPH